MPLRPLLDQLLPPTCILCGAPGAGGRDLCPGCAGDLPRNLACCARCALPLDGAPGLAALCGACQRRPPPYERSVVALRYEGPVPALVAMAKFRGRLNVARLLGELLADAIRPRDSGLPEVLLPVPLHPRRLRERGYNQALELARTAGRSLGVPVEPSAVLRILSTAPQAGLDERARRRNIRGAFQERGPLPWGHVAIVDDVVTTGSTVAELARVLGGAGVARVEVWAVARTP
jgi:ComF family protein